MSIIDNGGKNMSEQNTTVAKVTISKDNAAKLVSVVKDGLALVNKGYLAITPDVARLYDTKAYEVLGYKNFDDLCVNEFGMSHGTTVGIRKVFALYGTKSSKDGSYSIPEKYTEFGYTKLLLFATDKKKFEQAGINPIEEFSPKMTIGEMKSHLQAILTDKAKEQDATAVDTTATEDTNEETSIIDNSEEVATEEVATDNKEMTPNEIIDDMVATIDALRKEYPIRAEKAALYDAVISDLKEIKKEIKKTNK